MKRLVLMILSACAAALVVWRVTRGQEPAGVDPWDDAGGGARPPS